MWLTQQCRISWKRLAGVSTALTTNTRSGAGEQLNTTGTHNHPQRGHEPTAAEALSSPETGERERQRPVCPGQISCPGHSGTRRRMDNDTRCDVFDGAELPAVSSPRKAPRGRPHFHEAAAAAVLRRLDTVAGAAVFFFFTVFEDAVLVTPLLQPALLRRHLS